jgi:hypothetical protein
MQKALTDETLAKNILLSETEAKEVGVKTRIGKLIEEVNDLSKWLEEVSGRCRTTKEEWKIRQDDRVQEKAALNEAIGYLTETSFAQTFSDPRTSFDGDAEVSVVFAPSFTQIESSSQSSDESADQAEGAVSTMKSVETHLRKLQRKNTFDGVKTVVSKLIVTHQETQQEEAEKRTMCEKDLASTDDAKVETEDVIAELKANIGKKESEAIMLADEVKKLYSSIDQVRKSVEEAGKIRKKELGAFQTGSKDRALANRILRQAMVVLQRFYEKQQAKLLQEPPPQKWSKGSPRKTNAAFGAVSMIQRIVDGITREQKDQPFKKIWLLPITTNCSKIAKWTTTTGSRTSLIVSR